MELITLLLESFLYFVCVFVISENLYGYLKRDKKVCFVPLIVRILCLVLMLYIKTNLYFIVYMILTLIDILCLKFIFDNSKFRSIIYAYVLLNSFNIIISYLCAFLTNYLINDFLIKNIGAIVNVIILIMLSTFLKIRGKDLQPSFHMVPKSVKMIALTSILASAFIIGIFLDCGVYMPISKMNTIQRTVLVAIITVIGSIFPVLIANSIGKSFYNKQAKQFEKQIEIQAKHYEEMSKSNFELRRFKHDYKNMLIGVEKFLNDGDSDSALKLLRKQSQVISVKSNSFDTGNGIVDAILIEKQQKAETVHSTIKFDGAISTEKISPTDLCIIFGNTLDNAIEACEKLKGDGENMILVTCKSKGEYIFVKISNPVRDEIEIKNSNIKTSKEDKSNHGFGLYSLKKAIKKYGGNLSFNCVDNQFSVDLELTVPV